LAEQTNQSFDVLRSRCQEELLANELQPPQAQGMSNRTELAALKRLISEADQILETVPSLPENRTARCRELLSSALAITDDLLKQAKLPAAAAPGRKGGSAIAKRGSDYIVPDARERWPIPSSGETSPLNFTRPQRNYFRTLGLHSQER
jgi:hypothetical protein